MATKEEAVSKDRYDDEDGAHAEFPIQHRVFQFGMRAAALAGMVAPVAMVVGGLAGLIDDGGNVVLNTTCCPLRS
jgi:hypothetical protein